MEVSSHIEIEGPSTSLRRGFRQRTCSRRFFTVIAASTVIVFIVLCIILARRTRPSAWSNMVHIISHGGDASYIELMTPALLAIRYSYTGTYGSSRQVKEVNSTLGEGWERFRTLDADPEDGGFHGLVFWQAETRRLILAMRGMDLDSSQVSGQADTCGVMLLLLGKTYETLPRMCQRFSQQVLDYLASAEAFADRALEVFKPSETLMVGHSLGAGLSMLVAARLSRAERWQPRVLTLATVDFSAALKARVHRDFWELQADRYVIIDNSLDPVGWWSPGPSGVDGPTLCTFTSSPEPADCSTCHESFDANAWHKFLSHDWNSECTSCFTQVHTLGRYLRNLRGTLEKPPLHRPSCKV
mmetsp:Transcript_142840/g.259731  ORF Transcript_142840/g.259731 Transcript_142840/m.259731 type:complete len:357 (+) Transcript_142840:58-1128(+)